MNRWNLLFFSFLLTIGTVECVFRYVWKPTTRHVPVVADDEIGWRFKPSARFWSLTENDHKIEGRFNRFGFRDRDWSLQKQVGTYRIAVLGDSMVEAIQVESEATFLSLAEKALSRRSGHPVEMMNFGRSGTTQSEQYFILKRDVLKFSPDHVLLFFHPVNDIDDIDPSTSLESLRPFFKLDSKGNLVSDLSFRSSRAFFLKSFLNQTKQYSVFISFVLERVSAFRKGRKNDLKEKEQKQQKLRGYLSLATDHPDPVYVRDYKINKRLILEMVELCRKQGIKLSLVTIDHPAYQTEILDQYRQAEASFNPYFFDEDMGRLAKELRIDSLGLQAYFTKAYQSLKKPLHWSHWNYLGHQTVARAILGLIDH